MAIVSIKGKDISTMINGGTYKTKKTIANLSGLPFGTTEAYKRGHGTILNTKFSPSPFGITVDGKDISLQYEAISTEKEINIPDGVKKLLVCCIGGGQGGQGASGIYLFTEMRTFNNITYKYKESRDPLIPGRDGMSGEYKEYLIDVVPNNNYYTITIGKGSKGTVQGRITTNDTPNRGELPSFGGDTLFRYNRRTYIAKGGGNGNYGVSNPIDLPSIKFVEQGTGGKGGIYGYNMYGENNKGGDGTDGYCRIYFFW